MPKSKRSRIFYGVAVCGFVVVAAIVSCNLKFKWRDDGRARLRAKDLPITIQQAQPIIGAIVRFEKDHGNPPPDLNSLVPKYVDRLPNPGPVARDQWAYSQEGGYEGKEWSLYVAVRDEYSPNVFGFGDMFVFHPSGKYEKYAYGGVLMRFGKWGYYVE
jgi:hypothetical protein